MEPLAAAFFALSLAFFSFEYFRYSKIRSLGKSFVEMKSEEDVVYEIKWFKERLKDLGKRVKKEKKKIDEAEKEFKEYEGNG